MPTQELHTSIYVVAAICGNWWAESTMSPGIWEGLVVGANGYGLGQWSFGRRTRLFQYLDSHGHARDSGDGQIQFFIEEGTWYGTGTLNDFLNNTSTDIDDLTRQFFEYWESPYDDTLPYRQETARNCYQYILEHQNVDPSTLHWISGNRYLSIPERYNNVLLVYFALNGYLLNGKRGMPLWMKMRWKKWLY